MSHYVNAVIVILIVWLVIGAWRLRTRRVTPGAAAAGMMYEMLADERRAAIEIVVEEKAEYRDPEDRDGVLPRSTRRGRGKVPADEPPRTARNRRR